MLKGRGIEGTAGRQAGEEAELSRGCWLFWLRRLQGQCKQFCVIKADDAEACCAAALNTPYTFQSLQSACYTNKILSRASTQHA